MALQGSCFVFLPNLLKQLQLLYCLPPVALVTLPSLGPYPRISGMYKYLLSCRLRWAFDNSLWWQRLLQCTPSEAAPLAPSASSPRRSWHSSLAELGVCRVCVPGGAPVCEGLTLGTPQARFAWTEALLQRRRTHTLVGSLLIVSCTCTCVLLRNTWFKESCWVCGSSDNLSVAGTSMNSYQPRPRLTVGSLQAPVSAARGRVLEAWVAVPWSTSGTRAEL